MGIDIRRSAGQPLASKAEIHLPQRDLALIVNFLLLEFVGRIVDVLFVESVVTPSEQIIDRARTLLEPPLIVRCRIGRSRYPRASTSRQQTTGNRPGHSTTLRAKRVPNRPQGACQPTRRNRSTHRAGPHLRADPASYGADRTRPGAQSGRIHQPTVSRASLCGHPSCPPAPPDPPSAATSEPAPAIPAAPAAPSAPPAAASPPPTEPYSA